MRLQDMIFTGMDIPNEVRKMLSTINSTATNGMSTNEEKAYRMGVENTLSAVSALLKEDEHLVFHLKDNNCIEEFDLDELIEIMEEEGY